jgi:hypothetical protein
MAVCYHDYELVKDGLRQSYGTVPWRHDPWDEREPIGRACRLMRRSNLNWGDTSKDGDSAVAFGVGRCSDGTISPWSVTHCPHVAGAHREPCDRSGDSLTLSCSSQNLRTDRRTRRR